MSNRSSILRWALPPGVSLVIHAGLVVLLIVVGSRAAVIAANQSAKISLPLAELEYIARPLVVQDATEPNDVSVRASGRAVVRADQPVARAAASVLDRSAMSLAALGSVSSQAMSAATLEQLAQQSSWLSDEPSSVPAPISFAGVSTGAVRSIVYVIDASGATLTSLGYIRQRLLQSIDRLSPTQRFQVIAFRQLGESTHTLPELSSSRNKLPRATRANKQAVADWLADMPAQGRSNPVDGLAAALAFKPDMILLISRGITRTEAPWEGGLGAVRERLDELNPLDLIKGTRPVVIKTIQLLNEDPTGIMRTIGVFHGDGHNDHQVITYAQLVSPDPVPQARPSSDMDAWLTTVEDQLAGLKASGSYYRATTSLATDADRSEIEQAMVRINAVLRKADSGDGRAALLGGESLLVSGEVEESEALMYIEALGDAVFVSPELDGRRRIVVAQLYGRVGDLEAAIGELLSLLEEREALGLSTVSWGHGVLVLGSLMELDSVGFDQEPFTTDPAWALMLAQARSVFRLSGGREDAFWPLLELRKVLPAHEALIDASIARMLDGDDVDLMVFPDLVRFIFAHSSKANKVVGHYITNNFDLVEEFTTKYNM
ncbi:MAG: hypothetical protein JKY43_11540, partial [Phycisphaerales bacterium]|nr:hypothetical protein [Phycisphaerales bacterium]